MKREINCKFQIQFFKYFKKLNLKFAIDFEKGKD